MKTFDQSWSCQSPRSPEKQMVTVESIAERDQCVVEAGGGIEDPC